MNARFTNQDVLLLSSIVCERHDALSRACAHCCKLQRPRRRPKPSATAAHRQPHCCQRQAIRHANRRRMDGTSYHCLVTPSVEATASRMLFTGTCAGQLYFRNALATQCARQMPSDRLARHKCGSVACISRGPALDTSAAGCSTGALA